MEHLTSKLTAYLHDVLGISVSVMAWNGEDKLPFFLRDQYRFYQMNMLNRSCLLMVENSEEDLTPAIVLKQWKAVGGYWPEDAIYLTEICSAYNRKRLIEYKVPFIVPGNQMYLPMIGMDLRENFKTYHVRKRDQLRPSTQLLLMMVIHHAEFNGKSPSEFAHLLGYSAMCMTRSARELECMELARIHKSGRKQQIIFNALGEDLWLMARKRMINPVRKRIWVKSIPDRWPGILSGESALARYSMLGEPKYPVYAIASSGWNSICKNLAVEELTHSEPGCIQIELWRYSPERLADQGCVDRCSLWLSFQDSGDERIDMAVEDMMEIEQWQ